MFASKLKTLIVPVYVDDLLPMGDQVLVDNFTKFLPKVFKMSAVGEADFFLGLRIERLHDEHVLRIDQHAFVRTILNHFEVPDDATAPTPLSPQEDLAPLDTPTSQANPVTRSKYQSVIGSLMYLMLGTRLSGHGIFRTFISPNLPCNRTITNDFPSLSLILLRLHDSMTFTNDLDY